MESGGSNGNGGSSETFKLYIEQAGPRFGRYKRGVDIPKVQEPPLSPDLRKEMIGLFKRAILVNRESKKGFQKARAKRAVELFSPPSSEPVLPHQDPPEVHGFGLADENTPIDMEYVGEPPEKFPRRMGECVNNVCIQNNEQQQQQQQFYVGCAVQPSVPVPSVSPTDEESRPVAVITFEEIQNFMNELRISQQEGQQNSEQHTTKKDYILTPFYPQQQQQLLQQQQQPLQPQQQLLQPQPVQPQQQNQTQIQQTFSPFQQMEFTNFSLQYQPTNFTESAFFGNISQQQSQSPLQQFQQQQQQQQQQQIPQIQPQLQMQAPLEPQMQIQPPLQMVQTQPNTLQQQQTIQAQSVNPSQMQQITPQDSQLQYCQYGVNPEEDQPHGNINDYEMQQQQQEQEQQQQQQYGNLSGSGEYGLSNFSYDSWLLSGSGEPIVTQENLHPENDSNKTSKNGGNGIKNTGKQWGACTRKIASIAFGTPEKDRVAAYTETTQICWDFYRESAQYAQILLSESGVPSKYRTIRMGGLGGVAGGLKFMAVNNILFKSPELKMRNGTLYPDYDVAAKVAGHDFKSAIYFLSAVIDSKKSQYKVPLMTLVDYLGYRTVSMTLFPIGKISSNPSTSTTPSPVTATAAAAGGGGGKLSPPPQSLFSPSSLTSSHSESPMPQQTFICPMCQAQICTSSRACPVCRSIFNPEQMLLQQQQLMNAYEKQNTPMQTPMQTQQQQTMATSLSPPPPPQISAFNNENVTLLHGSPDGLHTLCYDPVISQDLEEICRKLNLKPHTVRSEDGIERFISTPFDMEVHRSSTNPNGKSRYVVDFSRLFPPVQRPSTPGGAEHLYRLFRPEFVREYQTPLSCDWVVGGTEAEAADVACARELLEGSGDNILPFQFADELLNISVQDYSIEELVFRLHARGINVRYLGLVRERLQDTNNQDTDVQAQHRKEWLCRVAVEMIARSFRKLLSARLRTLVQRRSRDTFVYQTIAHYLNSLIGRTASTEQLWALLHADIRTRFVQRGDWVPTISDIKAFPFGRPMFTELTAGFLGVEYYNDVWNTLQKDESYNVYEPYNATAIKSVVPRIKQMSLAYYSRGRFLHAQATDMEKSALDQKGFEPPAYLVQSAVKNYEAAVLRQPGCRICLRQLAVALEEELSRIDTDDSNVAKDQRLMHRVDVLKEKINFVYSLAVKRMPDDAITLYNMGVFNDLCGNTAEARKNYEKTRKICSNFIMCLCSLADSFGFDDFQRFPEESEKIYKYILQNITKDPAATNNLAVLLCTQKRFLDAAKYFCALIEMSSIGLWYGGLNCVAFCEYILQDKGLVEDMKNTVRNHNSITG